jgi:hypothetical protein
VLASLRRHDLLLDLHQQCFASASVKPKAAMSPRPSGRLIAITS